jgi:uncharacterized protein YfiM (DUF2279 family)
MRKFVLFTFLTLFSVVNAEAQTPPRDSTALYKKRKTIVAVGASTFYVASVSWLYTAWYQGYPLTGFHWKSDVGEWLGMDKLSHFHNSYQNGNYGYWMLRWAGVNRKKAIWFGGSWGLIYATTIEFFDGLSAEWGASYADIIANTTGAAFFISQQLLWNEQRIRSKFSYHPTGFPQYRPDLLGENALENLLKDYNGHTYWLSVNIHSFLPARSKFPAWINIAAGYGATGMIGAYNNPPEYEGEPLPHFDRTQQFYLSADIDWTKIKTGSNVLRFVFKLFSFVKLPFPTLEYNNKDGFVFHPLYF